MPQLREGYVWLNPRFEAADRDGKEIAAMSGVLRSPVSRGKAWPAAPALLGPPPLLAALEWGLSRWEAAVGCRRWLRLRLQGSWERARPRPHLAQMVPDPPAPRARTQRVLATSTPWGIVHRGPPRPATSLPPPPPARPCPSPLSSPKANGEEMQKVGPGRARRGRSVRPLSPPLAR